VSPSEHYFTARPASPSEQRDLRLRLDGEDVTVRVAPGVFSPGGLDKGTAVLLAEAPDPPATGHLLDLGCGWGPIALTLARRSPEATVWAVDVNERAVDLVRGNARRLALPNVRAARPDDVPGDLIFDAIWSNPPIRIGKAALHELLIAWLPRLRPGGTAYLVVQKNLGADSLHRWLAEHLPPDAYAVSRHASSKGFRVLAVVRH
jgi:16S rRNA (guanine1207-N2)-methyltransferase